VQAEKDALHSPIGAGGVSSESHKRKPPEGKAAKPAKRGDRREAQCGRTVISEIYGAAGHWSRCHRTGQAS
jgi:hypothetical protein